MSRREDIDTSIWGDADFGSLSSNAKLVYIWSFTNPLCGMSGVYKLRKGQVAFDLGINEDEEAFAWRELDRGRFAFFRGGVVFVRTRVKHLRTRTEQMVKSMVKDLDLIPADHEIRQLFASEYAESWPIKVAEKYSLDQAVLLNLDRTSPEVPGLGHGSGLGQGNGPNESPGEVTGNSNAYDGLQDLVA